MEAVHQSGLSEEEAREMSIREICGQVLKGIAPSPSEERRVNDLCDGIVDKVTDVVSKLKIEATVAPQGSVAKGTWLRDAVNIDIFILLPSTLTKVELGKVGLKIAKQAMRGYKQIDRYAEHPYLECVVPFDGVEARIDIVPCYRVEKGEWLSATDRTPYHTAYVCERLLKVPRMKKEVRLLKAFLRGIGIYGAEIRVQGLSGYGCELVTLAHGTFVNVLRGASLWRKGQVIDLEGYYRGRRGEARKLFADAPLILVDPIDHRRNVAAALSEDGFGLLVAAARRFLSHPDMIFFFPPKPEPFAQKELEDKMDAAGANFLLLRFGRIHTKAPDVLWGQLHKTRDALQKLLRGFEFKVDRAWVWSDEEENNVVLFKLESIRLPRTELHKGPPVHIKVDSDRFLKSVIGRPDTVFGPWIEGGRWVVEREREYAHARELLVDKLRDGGKNIGVAKLVIQSLKEGFEVLCDAEIWDFYRENKEFAEAMSRFLLGRPPWL